MVLNAFRTRQFLSFTSNVWTFNSSRRIGYATVVNLTVVAQSVAALVCEGFVIARNYQITAHLGKHSKNHAKISIYRKKTYRDGKHTALGREGRGRYQVGLKKKDVSVGKFSTAFRHPLAANRPTHPLFVMKSHIMTAPKFSRVQIKILFPFKEQVIAKSSFLRLRLTFAKFASLGVTF